MAKMRRSAARGKGVFLSYMYVQPYRTTPRQRRSVNLFPDAENREDRRATHPARPLHRFWCLKAPLPHPVAIANCGRPRASTKRSGPRPPPARATLGFAAHGRRTGPWAIRFTGDPRLRTRCPRPSLSTVTLIGIAAPAACRVVHQTPPSCLTGPISLRH